MSKLIKITPEQLNELGGKFLACSEQNTAMAKELTNLMNGVKGDWEGVSKERFFQSYSNADKELNNVSVLLKDVGDELKAIAERFRTADETK